MSDDFSPDPDPGSDGDSVTDVTTTSWLSRILQSIVGALIGVLLVIGAVLLLWWNEGRAVEASRALAEGARQVVEVQASAADAAAEGKLVHLSGMMETKAPARDPAFRVGADNLLRLKRTVEMFQWTEHKSSRSQKNLGGSETTATTYSYQKEWSESAVDSSRFREAGSHRNPPMPVSSATIDSPEVRLGAYRVDRAVLSEVSAFTAFDPQNPNLPAGYRKLGDMLYRGDDSAAPAIGDIKIRYAAVPAQTISVVAAQGSGTLAPFHAANGYTIALAEPGVVPAASMFRDKAEAEGLWTWIWRAVGFVLMLFGFVLMSSPLSVLVGVIPLLEELVGIASFLLALIIAVPLTLIVIAAAWIVHRPLVGVGLIVAGLGLAYLLRRLHRRPVQPPLPPPPTHFLPEGLLGPGR
jgi:hypothetical protein